MHTRFRALLFLLGSLSCTFYNVAAQSINEQACRSLADQYITDTNFLSATVVPASDDLPEFCRVLGYVRPAINFEIRLPMSDWNGKFYMTGCGGWCGKLESNNSGFLNAINYGLRRNYAVSTMDSGHWGENVADARWAYNNRLAEVDFGYRAVHETVRVTKIVIEALYNQGPEKSYYAGCSTGGRMGVMEAWRYPEDFDGIISGAPDIQVAQLVGINYAWLIRQNIDAEGEPIVTSSQVDIVEKAVNEACDLLDGVEDGLIDDPNACLFDPEILLCEQGESSDCLSMDQVKTIKSWYEGPKNSEGNLLYEGAMPLGSEAYWNDWFAGVPLGESFVEETVKGYYQYMAFEEDPGDSYSIMDFDFDGDPEKLDYMASIFNANNPELDRFREIGGKMLLWHGWGDIMVPPGSTIDYYESVKDHIGSREKTEDFFRVFMFPGMDHCGLFDGPGVQQNGIDLLTVLERWVEDEVPPTSIVTSKISSSGNKLWTRPVCPYPQRAEFNGQGDPNIATSFECVDP